MNIAVVFAGGTGQRMRSSGLPKQFLEVNQKAILVYTLEHFQNSNKIDKIIIVTLASAIELVELFVAKFNLTKVASIIPGGNTGQESIFNGLQECYRIGDKQDIVLLHDGVRPIIDNSLIERCISCVADHGNAITVSPAGETMFIKSESSNTIGKILNRSQCVIAKAPQCFYLEDIYQVHVKSKRDNLTFIDSASMMQYFGYELFLVEGPTANIKITTAIDFYTFKAYIDAKDSIDIFGL